MFKIWFCRRKLEAKGSGEAFFEQHSSVMVKHNRYSGSFDAYLQRERQI
jgi:hypothetical protein